MPRSATTRLIPSVPQLSYEHNDDSKIAEIIETMQSTQDTHKTERPPRGQKTEASSSTPFSSKEQVPTQDSPLIPASYIAVGIVGGVVFVVVTLSLGAAGAALVLRQKGPLPVVSSVCHCSSDQTVDVMH